MNINFFNIYKSNKKKIKNINFCSHVKSVNITEMKNNFNDIWKLINKPNSEYQEEINEILYLIFENFLNIKYYINNKIYYFSTWYLLTSNDYIKTIDELYNHILIDFHFQEIINDQLSDDSIIKNEIDNYLKNHIITGLCDADYYTDDYKIFKEKYLNINKYDLIKSDEEIDSIIELCKIIKNNYYFCYNIKKLILDNILLYQIFKKNKIEIIYNIIF